MYLACNWRWASSLAILIALGAGPAAPHPAMAGSIVGQVTAQGRPLPEDEFGSDAYAGRKARFVETIDYSRITDFVVYLDDGLDGDFPPPPEPVSVVTHRDSTFSPRLLPVLAGTTVMWPNQDDYYHNAFSVSEAKPFDLGLYKDEVKRLTFDTPGKVDVFCSIHKDMHCVILVLHNPYFAATDSRGRYRIDDVPPGTYTFKAWHERLPPQVQTVTVPEQGAVEIDFQLGVQGLPTY